MDIVEALDQLQELGHSVDRTPIRAQAVTFYNIDGLARSEEQILSHLLDGKLLHQQPPISLH